MTGLNSGKLSFETSAGSAVEIAFTDVQNLIGGSSIDSFKFNGGSLSGSLNGGEGNDVLDIFEIEANDQPDAPDSLNGTIQSTGSTTITKYTNVEVVRTPLIYQASSATNAKLIFDQTSEQVDLVDESEDSVLTSGTNKRIGSISEVRIIGSADADTLTINDVINRPVFFDGKNGVDVLVGPEETNEWKVETKGADQEGTLNDFLKFVNLEHLKGGLDDDIFRIFDDGGGTTSIAVAGARELRGGETDSGEDSLFIRGVESTDTGSAVELSGGAGRVTYSGIDRVGTRFSYTAIAGGPPMALRIGNVGAGDFFVKLMDTNSPTLLGERDLATISEVVINGSASSDTLTIDNSLIAGLPVIFNGNGGTDTVIGPDVAAAEDAADQPLWYIYGHNQGSLNENVLFSNVENLTGGDAKNTFYILSSGMIDGTLSGGAGAAEDTLGNLGISGAWTIGTPDSSASIGKGHFKAAASSISPGGVDFEDVENLLGGTLNDTFTFLPGGSISGRVEGGQGSDVADYSAYTDPVGITLASSGDDNFTPTTVSAPAASRLVDVDKFIGGSGSNDTLTGRAAINVYRATLTIDTLPQAADTLTVGDRTIPLLRLKMLMTIWKSPSGYQVYI